MKKLSLSIVTVLVFFVATAMAQTTPATDPTTTPTTASPSAPAPTPEAQAPAAQPGASTASTPAAGTQTAAEPKGEKKLKGCIESENGKFVLENKHGKEITLIGQDVSAHVGHQVVVHGTFQNSAASASGETPGTAASTSSTDMKAKAGQEFNVTSVDMVASTCKDKDKAEKKPASTQPPQK